MNPALQRRRLLLISLEFHIRLPEQMICLPLSLRRGPDVLFWGDWRGSGEALCLYGRSGTNRMLINYQAENPEVWKPSLPSAALMYFLFLLRGRPHISSPHLVCKPYFSHLCLLLPHSSGAVRCRCASGRPPHRLLSSSRAGAGRATETKAGESSNLKGLPRAV